jgi:phenylacetate-coenzyme A ligase PaaK-like adenylate-forming protein
MKTVYFSEADLELMVDYVAHGLRLMFPNPGRAAMLLLMPCEKPASIGQLVQKGIARIGVNAIPYGPPPRDGLSDGDIIELMKRERVTSLLSTPTAALRLSERAKATYNPTPGIDSVLLSAEYVPAATVSAIEENWHCAVYEHYGMTEMGLGCAMMCENRDGYHIREADLYVEIIDPATGKPLPDGETGEIVFTTLTREAHPLIRYRTGDTSRVIPEPCKCNSPLKRLARVGDRDIIKAY